MDDKWYPLYQGLSYLAHAVFNGKEISVPGLTFKKEMNHATYLTGEEPVLGRDTHSSWRTPSRIVNSLMLTLNDAPGRGRMYTGSGDQEADVKVVMTTKLTKLACDLRAVQLFNAAGIGWSQGGYLDVDNMCLRSGPMPLDSGLAFKPKGRSDLFRYENAKLKLTEMELGAIAQLVLVVGCLAGGEADQWFCLDTYSWISESAAAALPYRNTQFLVASKDRNQVAFFYSIGRSMLFNLTITAPMGGMTIEETREAVTIGIKEVTSHWLSMVEKNDIAHTWLHLDTAMVVTDAQALDKVRYPYRRGEQRLLSDNPELIAAAVTWLSASGPDYISRYLCGPTWGKGMDLAFSILDRPEDDMYLNLDSGNWIKASTVSRKGYKKHVNDGYRFCSDDLSRFNEMIESLKARDGRSNAPRKPVSVEPTIDGKPVDWSQVKYSRHGCYTVATLRELAAQLDIDYRGMLKGELARSIIIRRHGLRWRAMTQAQLQRCDNAVLLSIAQGFGVPPSRDRSVLLKLIAAEYKSDYGVEMPTGEVAKTSTPTSPVAVEPAPISKQPDVKVDQMPDLIDFNQAVHELKPLVQPKKPGSAPKGPLVISPMDWSMPPLVPTSPKDAPLIRPPIVRRDRDQQPSGISNVPSLLATTDNNALIQAAMISMKNESEHAALAPRPTLVLMSTPDSSPHKAEPPGTPEANLGLLPVKMEEPSPGPKVARKKIPSKVRMEVWKNHCGDSFSGACFCCRANIDYHSWHASHVISVNSGGGDEVGNLRPCCLGCNQAMGTMNLFSYIGQYGLPGPGRP